MVRFANPDINTYRFFILFSILAYMFEIHHNKKGPVTVRNTWTSSSLFN